MSKYVRYVVVGSKKLVEHAYSTQLGGGKALQYALDCANHFTMKGNVYGESANGSRELVYRYPVVNSEEEKG